MSARLALCALVAFVAVPAAAQAQSTNGDPTADITGTWSFSTVPYNFSCSMTGELVLEATDDPTRYDGYLTAFENCGDVSFEAKEASVGLRSGDQLTLTSSLIEVVPANEGYLADNFALKIVNSSLMVGELYFGSVVARAQFRRDGMIS